MNLPRLSRWWFISVVILCALLFGPLALIIAGNVGGSVLNAVLNRRPTIQELIGTYEYDPKWGHVSLRLDSNGTFVEVLREFGKAQKTISGTWQARPKDNYLDVSFQPFGLVNDDDHESLTENSGMPFFQPRAGKTYGLVDDDSGEEFKQQ